MGRKNFYLLLELPVDPPETDPKKIEEAIKQKQAQWSRYRNHPTKGIEAKQNIGLIPEIKELMADPERRQQEAEEAQKILSQQEKKRFSEIDKHLKLLLSKGSISNEEITALAKLHNIRKANIEQWITKRSKAVEIDYQIEKLMKKGQLSDKTIAKLAKNLDVEEGVVTQRIKKKEQDNLAEIDAYLLSCVSTGFITEKEVDRLSELYGIGTDVILQRSKCPLKKEVKKTDRITPLDPTIEKLITDNLRIVGKQSLYDFLGTPQTSALEKLQEKSKKKENEIRNIGQKDAVTTASGALAGHCIAIFMTEESRQAYDLSLTRARIPELNAMIDMAGFMGNIKSEYYEELIKFSLKLGMGPDEAASHIKEYAKTRKWSIELSQKKKKGRFKLVAAVAAGILLVIIASTGIRMYTSYRAKNIYERVVADVEKKQTLEDKLNVLRDYLKHHGKSKYNIEARKMIRDVKEQIEERDFAKTIEDGENFVSGGNYEQALDVYALFMKDHPESDHGSEIEQLVFEAKSLIDERDYQNLRKLSNSGFDERIGAYKAYLRDHPNGRYTEEVNQLAFDAIKDYHFALKKQLSQCEKSDDWEKCIQLSNTFIDQFGDIEGMSSQVADLVADIQGLKTKFQKNLQRDADLVAMRKSAETLGTDYEGAKRIYLEYLKANPESTSYIRGEITRALDELDRKIALRDKEISEWKRLSDLAKNSRVRLSDKIRGIEKYLRDFPSGQYVTDAKNLLTRLQSEKADEDERMRVKQELDAWQKTLAEGKNPRINFQTRIQRVKDYIDDYPNGRYSADAQQLLNYLIQEKNAYDEKIRAKEAAIARVQQKRQEVSAMLQRTGGRFVVNGNNTVVDRKTGLTWTLLDSYSELGRCLDYPSAQDYVNNLRTGGYRDWRMPTANELVQIYKTEPFFPSKESKWFWTSEIIWRGWNKVANIVTSRPETVWRKEQAELTKCGSVHAVRN